MVCAAPHRAQARDAAERALALEPDLAAGHAAIGWIQLARDWDWRAAATSFARALALEPGNVSALRRAGTLVRTQGRLEEAIGLYRRALEHDPLSAATYSSLGLTLYAADRFAEAEAALREMTEKCGGTAAYQVAEVHGPRGEANERAYERRDSGLPEVRISPRLRSLHRDPRWGAFIKKMGLEDWG